MDQDQRKEWLNSLVIMSPAKSAVAMESSVTIIKNLLSGSVAPHRRLLYHLF